MIAFGIQLNLCEWQPDGWFHEIVLAIYNTYMLERTPANFHLCVTSKVLVLNDAAIDLWWFTSAPCTIQVASQLREPSLLDTRNPNSSVICAALSTGMVRGGIFVLVNLVQSNEQCIVLLALSSCEQWDPRGLPFADARGL